MTTPEASVGRRPSRIAPDQTYGDLVVLGPCGWLPNDAGSTEAPRVGHRVRAWRCACVCGTVVRVRGSHLVAGQVRSCGCLAAVTCWGRRTDLDGRAFGVATVAEGGRSDEVMLRCPCGTLYAAPRARVLGRPPLGRRANSCPSCRCATVETGRRVRGWTVVKRAAESGTRGEARWIVRCDTCGAQGVRYGHHLRRGKVAPCRDCEALRRDSPTAA